MCFAVAVEANVSVGVDGGDDGVGYYLSVGEVEVGCVGSSAGAWVHGDVSALVSDFWVNDGDV